MADFYEHFTITPAAIPAALVSAELLDELRESGVSVDTLPRQAEGEVECIYLYGEYSFDQEALPPLLQRLVQEAEGQINNLIVEGAQLCTTFLPESHGGFALVITATEIRECWTSAWIQHTLKELDGAAQTASAQTGEEASETDVFEQEADGE